MDAEGVDSALQAKYTVGRDGVPYLASELCRRIGIQPARSVRMTTALSQSMVFNLGGVKRLLATTQDSPLQLRLRTLLTTSVINEFKYYLCGRRGGGELPVYTDLGLHVRGEILNEKYSLEECNTATATKFMASGGTHLSMGRVLSAIPVTNLTRVHPITRDEANLAYEQCGMYHGSIWQQLFPQESLAYGGIWPLTTSEGVGRTVEINKHASLGYPYLAKASDPTALQRCLEVVKYMDESADWANAGEQYRRCMATSPLFVLFGGKTKNDIYTAEKIREARMRFYLVMPGHLKLFIQQAAQPFAKAKRTLLDVWDHEEGYRLRSAQKMGVNKEGATRIIRGLDKQLARGPLAYLHCGDDTLFAMRTVSSDTLGGSRPDRTRHQLTFFGVDMSNFDLTQQERIIREVDDRLAEGLASIDARRSSLWREIRRRRLVNIHQSGVVFMDGLGTSGINLQSEVNDMLMDVYCQRLERRLRKYLITYDGVQTHRITHAELLSTIQTVATEMGFVAKLEFVKSEDQDHLTNYTRPRLFNNAASYALLEGCYVKFLGYNISTVRAEEYDGYAYPMGFKFMVGEPVTPEDVVPEHRTYMSLPGAFSVALGSDELLPLACAVCDLPRSLANLNYASKTWIKRKREFEMYNLVRVFGTLQTLGLGTEAEEQAFMLQAVRSVSKWLAKDAWRLHNETIADAEVDEAPAHVEGVQLPLTARQLVNMIWKPPSGGQYLPEGEMLRDVELRDKPKLVNLLRTGQDPETVGGAVNLMAYRLYRVWDPRLRLEQRDWVRDMPGVVIPAPLLTGSSNWADLMEEEAAEALETYMFYDMRDEDGALIASTWGVDHRDQILGKLQAFREATLANWGRPPPNVAVRHTTSLNPQKEAFQPGAPGTGSSKTRKTKARKQRAKAKRQGEFRQEDVPLYEEDLEDELDTAIYGEEVWL